MADTATTGVAAAAQTNEPLIRVEGLRKSFGSLEVLKGIDLSVKSGEVVTIIGASGSGKSTFLRCLNLLETPDAGHIWFHGQDLTAERCNINKLREDIGMVFQGFNLFNNMDVLDNCTLAPVTLKKMSKAEAEKIAMEHLTSVGLEKFAHAAVGRLSGGQKQRVAIARALCMNPQIMLFDEPTSALDPEIVGEVLEVMRCRRHDHGCRHARDGLCPHRVRSRGLYGQGRGARGRRAGRALRQSQAPAHPRVPLALSRGQITDRKRLRGRAAPVGRPLSSQSKGCHGRGLALLCA